jgi:hypothetical protein
MRIRVLATVVAAAALVSCGSAHDPVTHSHLSASAADSVDDLSPHQGQFCPRVLPRASRATYGFGDERPAATTPTLSMPQEAWICEYVAKDVAPDHSKGAWYEWVRRNAPRPLDTDERAAFSIALEHLQPPAEDSECTMELGPRYLVSYAYRQDLTGVVIDDYGCDDVHLTDDPFTTVAGDSSQPGMVTGVLRGPAGFLRALGVG